MHLVLRQDLIADITPLTRDTKDFASYEKARLS
jgi:hypothetical protein